MIKDKNALVEEIRTGLRWLYNELGGISLRNPDKIRRVDENLHRYEWVNENDRMVVLFRRPYQTGKGFIRVRSYGRGWKRFFYKTLMHIPYREEYESTYVEVAFQLNSMSSQCLMKERNREILDELQKVVNGIKLGD